MNRKMSDNMPMHTRAYPGFLFGGRARFRFIDHKFATAYIYILINLSTPWAIKKRATLIFLITLANIDGFS